MPALSTGGGVKCRDPTTSLGKRVVIDRTAEVGAFSGIRLLGAGRFRILVDLRTPLIVARHDQQVELGIVAGAVPFAAAQRSRANTNRSGADRSVRIDPRHERDAVENLMRVSIDHTENAILARRSNYRMRVYFEDWIDVRDVVIVHIMGKELIVPGQLA